MPLSPKDIGALFRVLVPGLDSDPTSVFGYAVGCVG